MFLSDYKELNVANLADWQCRLILDLADRRATDAAAKLTYSEAQQYDRDAVDFLADTGLGNINAMSNVILASWRITQAARAIEEYRRDIPARIMNALHKDRVLAYCLLVISGLAVLVSLVDDCWSLWTRFWQR